MAGPSLCPRRWRLWALPLCACACFFFFQAEDGIRDLIVTGVQTCALPILRVAELRIAAEDLVAALAVQQHLHPRLLRGLHHVPLGIIRELAERHVLMPGDEIGRASCRERV